jgi:hypothetical protein
MRAAGLRLTAVMGPETTAVWVARGDVTPLSGVGPNA